jgi:predicted RNA binding protein YcfA (HicA-like mRNA interferase family)
MPPVLTVREVIKLIEADGWVHISTSGSHRQFEHHTKKGRVTVPGKLSFSLQQGTLISILKQAGLRS